MANADESAFPHDLNHCAPGMTKREFIAAMALQGLLANAEYWRQTHDADWPDLANNAVAAADVLLAELAKEEG